VKRPPHLLAVNFRDPAHPEAGGAELHLEEILLAAVARGFRVTWLASGFPGAQRDDQHRGISVKRRGAWWNFNWIVPGVLRRECSDPPPDLVVEDINKVPCLTPWWTSSEAAVIVPHLFGATAFREASWPVALYVVALEALIPLAYARARFLAISESTREDLERRGIARSRVSVVHCGLDHRAYRTDPEVPKADRPTVLFVGRLRRYKGVDWLLRSLPAVLERVPQTRLVLVGDGPYRRTLESEAVQLRVQHAVEFVGFVPEAEKARRMQEAWVVVQPSPKEGWGLTVVEAGACGTAVVAADSPGLRDSVRRDVTGLLVRFGDTSRLAEALVRVLDDPALRARLAASGIEWARRFTWPDSAARSLDALLGGHGCD
jgi:glycosyltransferase involved in cell wall biosynthesis